MANKNPGNVVQIHEHAAYAKRADRATAVRLLRECSDRISSRIAGILARAMDNVDDSLFALAEKAGTNALQEHYFDAMREIRLNRRQIETSFAQYFAATAEVLVANPRAEPPEDTLPGIADAGVGLTEYDDVEESLAIHALSDKLEALCHNELSVLNARAAVLLEQDGLAAEANPIGPRALCMAFKTACGDIKSGVDIKIIVFKLFDKYLCEGVQALYRDINDYLAGNDVLSKIPAPAGGDRQTVAEQAIPDDDKPAPQVDKTEAVAAFTRSMSGDSPRTDLQSDAGMPAGRAEEDAPAPQQDGMESLAARIAAIDPAALAGGTTNVARIIKDKTPGNNEDGMIIEIVALLFDYIFDNDGIPDQAKALMGRLQIPTLKIAIMDRTFFSKRHHPARRLLNALAQATTGLNGEPAEQSALYSQLEDCINTVQVQPDTDIAVFETALEKLEAYLAKHQEQRNENVEEAKKIMQGRERLKVAESLAEAAIERELEGKPFPEFIRTFAMDKWKNLLTVAYAQEGQEGEAWKTRLETLGLLIWSTLPKSTHQDKKKLVDILPGLVAGLEKGMKLLAMEDGEQGEFLEKLASCHARSVNAEAYSVSKPALKPRGLEVSYLPTEGGMNSVATAARAATTKPGARQIGAMLVEDLPLLDQGVNQYHSRPAAPERLMFSIDPFAVTAPVEISLADDEPQKTVAAADEYSDLIGTLFPGVWLEFRDGDVKTVERLSWISSILGSYLFTDHDGLKTRELSARELEIRLRDGRAAIADDMDFLVDHSFNGLLGQLQKKAAD